MVKYGRIWQNMAEYGRIWQNMVNWFKNGFKIYGLQMMNEKIRKYEKFWESHRKKSFTRAITSRAKKF